MTLQLNPLDAWLMRSDHFSHAIGLQRFLVEFLFFGLKQARACMFAGLFFLSIFLVPADGLFYLAKYNVLLIIALSLQALMIGLKLESWDELKAITLFHVVGFALEVFKTQPAIGSWTYPGDGFSKVFGIAILFKAEQHRQGHLGACS